ncbi:MAG: hypothetical protein H6867_06805 [Rhodospirillales bacterium]|nr:hypothetical protein [Rhodospirillales bacterium]MCB9995259.1 hypothetical protein [Rhodospirillales bacterium]
MAKKRDCPYRTDDAQKLLDAAKKAFEQAEENMIRRPHRACAQYTRAVKCFNNYAEMVNTARQADGRGPLSENQLLNHVIEGFTEDDVTVIAKTIQRNMERKDRESEGRNASAPGKSL